MAKINIILYGFKFLLIFAIYSIKPCFGQVNKNRLVTVEYLFNMPIKAKIRDIDSITVTHRGGLKEDSFDGQNLLYKLNFEIRFKVIGDIEKSIIDLRNPDVTGSNFIGNVVTPEVISYKDSIWTSQKEGKKQELKFREVTYKTSDEIKTILGYKCRKLLIFNKQETIEATAWVTNDLPWTIIPTSGYKPSEIGGAVLALESVSAGGNFVATKITKE